MLGELIFSKADGHPVYCRVAISVSTVIENGWLHVGEGTFPFRQCHRNHQGRQDHGRINSVEQNKQIHITQVLVFFVAFILQDA